MDIDQTVIFIGDQVLPGRKVIATVVEPRVLDLPRKDITAGVDVGSDLHHPGSGATVQVIEMMESEGDDIRVRINDPFT